MDMAMKILFIGQALSFAELRSSAFEGPEDTIAYVRDNVTMRCSSGSGDGCSGITWRRRLSASPSLTDDTIFKYNELAVSVDKRRYSVDTNASGCHVIIRDVQYNDSGRYNCEVVLQDKTTAQKGGSLIILESKPKCVVNLPRGSNEKVIEGEEVTFTCESTYDVAEGNMIWKGVERDRSKEVEKSGNTYTLSYSVVAGPSDISPLVCEVQFKPQNTADDVNSLRVSCQTPTVEVLFSARNVRLDPLSSAYSPGSVVTCLADGNPPPVIRWQSLNTRNASTWRDVPETNGSSQLVVGSDVFVRYRCVASNVVRNSSHSDVSCHIGVGETDGRGYSTVVAIAVGFVTGFLAAIVLLSLVWFVRWRFFKHRSATIQKE